MTPSLRGAGGRTAAASSRVSGGWGPRSSTRTVASAAKPKATMRIDTATQERVRRLWASLSAPRAVRGPVRLISAIDAHRSRSQHSGHRPRTHTSPSSVPTVHSPRFPPPPKLLAWGPLEEQLATPDELELAVSGLAGIL